MPCMCNSKFVFNFRVMLLDLLVLVMFLVNKILEGIKFLIHFNMNSLKYIVFDIIK
jgi:hypothetical protein